MLTQPYMFISGRITLPVSSLDRSSTYPALHGLTQLNYHTRSPLDRTSAYSALHGPTRPNYLTQYLSDQTSAYTIVPGHLTQLSYPAG
jgi:hypothetical protein